VRAFLAYLLIALLPGAVGGERETRAAGSEAGGPLQVLSTNSRYFTDGSGKAVYLTGSHVWWTLPRPLPGAVSCAESPWVEFDVTAYLDRMAALGHNFLRLWTWEATVWRQCGTFSRVKPHPWLRTGPGRAWDGGRKFDLRRLNPAYFKRLRLLVELARARGIYVSVMLFEGWALQHAHPWHWRGHPFNRANNVNRLRPDTDRNGYGTEVHTLRIPRITRIQEGYVRRVLDTVGDLDNVLIEISNESGHYSTAWQYHMIEYVKAYQARRGLLRHPVGMSFQHDWGDNDALHRSAADWIAPYGPEYMSNPPAASGAKVVVSDSDHHCGHTCKDFSFAWKSFVRGVNPIYMDTTEADPEREAVRQALGATRRLADRIDLAALTPQNGLATTSYCLCTAGSAYVVYQPATGPFFVDLGPGGIFRAEWIDPLSGSVRSETTIEGASWTTATPPSTGPVVLYLRRIGG
jgi:hypothetical protein